ncbi:hypothetical protein EVAR_36027_1 [Eumeta japonica]|uniref:Uncharacterized protein n=1 Tax=Eumeta variegata TaxID=151549 RepID=A0A4C1WQJ9_EUMVA|nr:hypothetical protein EVAR_36027_1 [Eumeta japonica]
MAEFFYPVFLIPKPEHLFPTPSEIHNIQCSRKLKNYYPRRRSDEVKSRRLSPERLLTYKARISETYRSGVDSALCDAPPPRTGTGGARYRCSHRRLQDIYVTLKG